MYFYFSGGYPSAIKLNGLYFGMISDTVKSCKLELSDSVFAEICPLGKGPNVSFIINENLLCSPPDGISITDLQGGYLIHANNRQLETEFKILGQEKYPDLIVTVFNENGLKISLETPSNFFADNLSFQAESASFHRFSLDGEQLIAIELLGVEKILLIYILSNLKCIFTDNIENFSFDNGLTTTQRYKDIAKHLATTNWRLHDGNLKPEKKNVSTADDFSIDNLTEQVLPYAFLEEYMVGGDIKQFLGGNVLQNSDKLNGFFGEFIGIMPPPTFRNPNEIGLIRKLRSNLFKADYIIAEIQNRKIINLKKV